jgi:Ricin-type beta-trefoil lectin domain-like
MSNYCFLKNKLTGNVIDISRASSSPGAPLDAYPQKPRNENQLWWFFLDPSGYWTINSRLNGCVIDIVGASTQAGALLDTWPLKPTGNDNQLWNLVPDGTSGYFFIQSKLNGYVIDIVQASTQPGARLDAWPKKTSGNDNQLWKLVPQTAIFPGSFPLVGVSYYIQSKLNGYVIDILGGLAEPGVGLDAWPKKDTDNQLWTFFPDPAGSGYSFISNPSNFYVIDIMGASTQAGALLDAYPSKSTGTDNQLWKFVPQVGGWGFIESKLNGNVIDIAEASTQPGAPLISYPKKASGTDNQLWMPVGPTYPGLPSSLSWTNVGTGSGTTSGGATKCAYNLNLTIQQDGTCHFWGSYTNRGDIPLFPAPSQSFGVAIVVLDAEGNGYSFGAGSQNVPSAPQPGSTYSWNQTQKSAAIADNWGSIAARNWEYHNEASLADILKEIEQAIEGAIGIFKEALPVITTIMAPVG